MNAGYEHAHTLRSIAGFGKNEQNLMGKKLSKVKSNFYFFQTRKKIVVEVLDTVDPPRLVVLFTGQL